MDDLSENSAQDGLDKETHAKKGRGATWMKDIQTSDGEKKHVTFNRYFQANGPDPKTKSKFNSYIAVLGRSKVSILIPDWRKVTDRNKEQICQALLEQYDVPDNEKLKKKVFSRAGDAWRGFTTKLSDYIFVEKIGLLPYDDGYPFLDADTWKAFVASRQTPDFLKIRKKAQESQSYNLSPHILSRGGYDFMIQKIMDEKYRTRKEASTDPSEIIPPPSPPSRHELWKRARITKKGDYVSKEAKIVADKISSFKPVGRNDILATALGKPEHPGRVRGVWKGVGIKDFFGPSSYSGVGKDMVSRDEMETIISRRIDQMKDKMKNEIMMMIGKSSSIAPSPNSPRIQSTTESCAPNVFSLDEHNEDKECELYVENPQRILVAYGRIHNLGPTIHNKKMNEDEVRVVVSRVIVGDAPVPCPTEEVTTVEEAPNNFITWPRRLVKGANAKDKFQSKPVTPKPIIEPETDVVTTLWMASRYIKNPICINMSAEIFGEKRDFYIFQKDIMELLQSQKLCISIIEFFNMYLYNVLKESEKEKKFEFLCPLKIQTRGNSKEEIEGYIARRMEKENYECIFAPYFSEEHWQLMILCPKQNKVVWLCSLRKDPNTELVNKINSVFRTYFMVKGKRNMKPKWVPLKCRKHLGNTECGYFVMRYMLEIISLDIIDSFEEAFNIDEPYSGEDIENIKMRWSKYFLEVTSLGKYTYQFAYVLWNLNFITVVDDYLMASNSYQWPVERTMLGRVAVTNEMDSASSIAANVVALLMNNLQGIKAESVGVREPVEDVNYVNNQNFGNFRGPQEGNTYYYQGNRNQSNLSYANPNNALQQLTGFSVTNGAINVRYPALCAQTLTRQGLAPNVHMLSALINKTLSESKLPNSNFEALSSHFISPEAQQARLAIDDCHDLMGMSVRRLNQAVQALETTKSPEKHKEDIQTWLSAAITFQQACKDSVEGHVASTAEIHRKMDHLSELVSNPLALTNRITKDPTAKLFPKGRGLVDSNSFPGWVSGPVRKLLQSTEIRANAVVAKDGSGDYTTVTEAIRAAFGARFVIYVKSGTYNERINSNKDGIMLIGDGKYSTIITGSGSVAKGSTLRGSATFTITGDGFIARDIGFSNTAGLHGEQAVALTVSSDRSVMYRCSIAGYQDTLYALSLRQFYRDCDIYGTIDFIFGNAAAVLQSCSIVLRQPRPGGAYNVVLASGRTDPGQNTGFAVHNSRISGSGGSFLGRPWKQYARVVVMQTNIDASISGPGWVQWPGADASTYRTLYFAEYENMGPGARLFGRVGWPGFRVIGPAEAEKFTVANFIGGNSWLPSTGVTFVSGL
ncbi:plant invertase/pectin methylesterase inhibitor [Striga asiatica]|uniref:pectinesterase n=1 Tax=Striga asiatica TaxID=4170 RepID=A0A5A7R4C2_STRAF|nr:plant invertase/pectin methylesterase inhibitor [Striga asiatica]